MQKVREHPSDSQKVLCQLIDYALDRCLKHHWDEADGKELEKQFDVVVLLKTRRCV